MVMRHKSRRLPADPKAFFGGCIHVASVLAAYCIDRRKIDKIVRYHLSVFYTRLKIAKMEIWTNDACDKANVLQPVRHPNLIIDTV
jgi:hypothetical protein